MKAFLCYLQPFGSFTQDSMWLAEERPPEDEEIDSIEVEVPPELFNQIWGDDMEPAAVEEVFRQLWEGAAPRLTK